MHVLISVSFSLFSSLISEDDKERRERERRRKEKLEQRGQRGDTQGDQARVDRPGCEQARIILYYYYRYCYYYCYIIIILSQARIEAGREVMRRGPGQGAVLFVPECDLSGQYEPVQCYR